MSDINVKKNYVEINECREVKCLSAFNGRIKENISFERALESNRHHPISGALCLRTKEKYNILIIDIIEISIDSDIVWSVSKSAGVNRKRYAGISRKASDRCFRLYTREQLDVKPSIGFIGITNYDEEVASSGRAGKHGGNLDFPFLKEGCKVYLPTNGESDPSLWIGDLHAIQGYGELSGISYECSGQVTVKMNGILRDSEIMWPYAIYQEGKNEYIAFMYATYDKTIEQTIEELVDYLISIYELFKVETKDRMYEIIGVYGSLLMGQVAGRVKTIAIRFLKKDINIEEFV